jgi:hypothetical protein
LRAGPPWRNSPSAPFPRVDADRVDAALRARENQVIRVIGQRQVDAERVGLAPERRRQGPLGVEAQRERVDRRGDLLLGHGRRGADRAADPDDEPRLGGDDAAVGAVVPPAAAPGQRDPRRQVARRRGRNAQRDGADAVDAGDERAEGVHGAARVERH